MFKELNLSVPVYSIFNKMFVQSIAFPSHSTSRLPWFHPNHKWRLILCVWCTLLYYRSNIYNTSWWLWSSS